MPVATQLPIRVLLWLAPGIHRAIVADALARETGILVLDDEHPDASAVARGPVLREALGRSRPDVVVAPVDAEEIRRLTIDRIGDTAAVFISTDSRTAMAFDRDVSTGTLVRLIRAVAR